MESFIQIRAVADCGIYYLGELPFDLRRGTCGTYNVNSVPTIFLCFDREQQNTCRGLTVKKDLLSVTDFEFDEEFEVRLLPETTYQHSSSTIANYKGKL